MTELPPFEDPAIQLVYERLATFADGRGWRSTPLRRGGSSLERTWVQGEPGKQPMPAPGTARLQLSVLAYSNPTSSYGLTWSAGICDDKGRGVRLVVASDTRGFSSDQVRIDLNTSAGAVVQLGAPLNWAVGERTLQTAGPTGLTEVRAKLNAYQGAAFAAEATQDLDALDALVRPILDSGDYTFCEYGPSPGQGIPGICIPRAPTPAENEAQRLKFDTELARRRTVLGDGLHWRALLDEIAPSPL